MIVAGSRSSRGSWDGGCLRVSEGNWKNEVVVTLVTPSVAEPEWSVPLKCDEDEGIWLSSSGMLDNRRLDDDIDAGDE